MTWVKVKINDVMLVTDYVANGSFASLKENVKYSYEQDFAVLVRTTDNSKGWNGQYVYVNKDSYNFLNKSRLIPNDIIIANVGEPGKAFLCPDLGQPMTLGPNSILVRPLEENIVDNRFFFYFTISKNGQEQIEKICSATTQKKFNKTSYRNLEIPLPPLPVQKKIADILDAADAYRQKTKALIEKYDELGQSLFLDMFGDPVKNEKGWEVVKLHEVTSKIGSGATPKGGKDSYKESGISLIRSLNVHDHTFKYKDLAFIDTHQAKRLENVKLRSGDVLFNITGASVCRCCVLPNELLPARVNQHVAIIRPKQEILNSTYLEYYLTSPNIKRQLLEIGSKGGATREAITKQDLQNYHILLPKIEKQLLFEENLKTILTQKELLAKTLENAKKLFQSLLQKAFKGELI